MALEFEMHLIDCETHWIVELSGDNDHIVLSQEPGRVEAIKAAQDVLIRCLGSVPTEPEEITAQWTK